MVKTNLKLTIELVPASSWNLNLRSFLKPQMWRELRKKTYERYNFRCAICATRGKLQAHEVWEYNDKKHIQKLKGLISLCNSCHLVKHFGFAGVKASQGKADFRKIAKHFMKVNKCDYKTFEKHYTNAFKKFEERSRYDWQIDIIDFKSI